MLVYRHNEHVDKFIISCDKAFVQSKGNSIANKMFLFV